jgi:hypothetical protein
MMMNSQIKNDIPPAQYFDSVNTVDRQPLVRDDTDTRPPKSRRKGEEELEEQEEERQKKNSIERRRGRTW